MVVERFVLFKDIVSGCREGTIRVLLQGALPICKTFLVFRDKGCMKRGLKTVSNIVNDILNKVTEQPVGNILKTRFSQAQGNLAEKNKNMTVSGMTLKRKRKTRKSQSQGKRRKAKDIFTEEKKNKK